MKAVVLIDTYRYLADPENPASSAIVEAEKGDEIDVSQAEFDRGAAMDPPGLGKPGSDASGLGKLTVADLDELADEHDVDDYPAEGKKAEKVSALETAGVQPPGE